MASKNREAFHESGLFYPNSVDSFNVDPRPPSANAHFSFANALVRLQPKDKRLLDAFLEQIKEELAAGNDVLISAESLFRHVIVDEGYLSIGQGTLKDRRLKWETERERFIERLASFFDGLPVEIIMYLRRPDSFMQSMYSEVVVNSTNRQHFGRFIQQYQVRFDYNLSIKMFSKFWDLRLFNFEDAKSSLPFSFFSELGLPEPSRSTTQVTRASIPKAAVLWLCRTKNEKELNARERSIRWLFALQKENATLFRAKEDTTFWSNTSQRDAFLDVSGLRFESIKFAPPSKLPETCNWEDHEHGEAERLFEAWSREKASWIAERKANLVPAFVNSQAPC
ncbi:hypothetical protein CSC82_01810 [Rhodobacteraceae bacterium 4F10]|nr:hypothetical protein CSC82_01810 [Rhodobacteraceae bacterium 4F10]